MKSKLRSLVLRKPIRTSINAVSCLNSKNEGKGESFWGLTVSHINNSNESTVEISCRLFLNFLSGITTWDTFSRNTKIFDLHSPSIFSIFCEKKLTIIDTTLEKYDMLDDDKIKFEFSEKKWSEKLPEKVMKFSENQIVVSLSLLFELLAGKIQKNSMEFQQLNKAFSSFITQGSKIESILVKEDSLGIVEIKFCGIDPAISDYQ